MVGVYLTKAPLRAIQIPSGNHQQEVVVARKTSEWTHYDEAAITIAAALIRANVGKAELHDLARQAYDGADALAREANRRRLIEPVMLHDDPVLWIQEVRDSKSEASREISMKFLVQMLAEGAQFGSTFQEAAAKVEALSPEEVGRFIHLPPNLDSATVRQSVWKHAVELLRGHLEPPTD